jgi:patatin-like phospholipase/acyl hydrolase
MGESSDLAIGTSSAAVLHRPRILVLDGVGIQGLESLFVLKNVMERISGKLELDDPALPCEYFDLIGGAGMGGLIAIMLGRLGMVRGLIAFHSNSLDC